MHQETAGSAAGPVRAAPLVAGCAGPTPAPDRPPRGRIPGVPRPGKGVAPSPLPVVLRLPPQLPLARGPWVDGLAGLPAAHGLCRHQPGGMKRLPLLPILDAVRAGRCPALRAASGRPDFISGQSRLRSLIRPVDKPAPPPGRSGDRSVAGRPVDGTWRGLVKPHLWISRSDLQLALVIRGVNSPRTGTTSARSIGPLRSDRLGGRTRGVAEEGADCRGHPCPPPGPLAIACPPSASRAGPAVGAMPPPQRRHPCPRSAGLVTAGRAGPPAAVPRASGPRAGADGYGPGTPRPVRCGHRPCDPDAVDRP